MGATGAFASTGLRRWEARGGLDDCFGRVTPKHDDVRDKTVCRQVRLRKVSTLTGETETSQCIDR